MPITQQLDTARHRILTTVTGEITFADVRSHLEAVRSADAFTYAELVDARGAGEPRPSASVIWNAAELFRTVRHRTPVGPRAIVVRSEFDFGLARVFAMLVSPAIAVHVFRDSGEAEAWLERATVAERAPTG